MAEVCRFYNFVKDDASVSLMARANIATMAATVFSLQEEYASLLGACDLYFDAYDKLKDNKEQLFWQSTIFVFSTFAEELQSKMAGFRSVAKSKMLEKIKEENPGQFEEMYKLETAIKAQAEELIKAGKTAEYQATKQELENILMKTFGVKTLH